MIEFSDILDLLNNLYVQIALGVLGFLAFLGIIVLVFFYIEYRKSTGGRPLTFKYLFALSIFIGGLPIILSSLGLFWIYKKFLSVLLTIKYGSKFAGFLKGTDAIHTIDMEDISKNCGNILFIVRKPANNNNSPIDKENFGPTVREAIIKRFKETTVKTPKLWYSWQHYSGYCYFLKDQLTPEECVRVMEHKYCENGQEIDKDDFLKFISKHYSNQRMPRDHTGLWEVLVGTHPIKWKTSTKVEGEKFYPVLFRIHHGLSDATALLKGIVRIFADVPIEVNSKLKNGNLNYENGSKDRSNIFKRLGIAIWNKISSIMLNIYLFLMVPPILLIQGLIKGADDHELHGPELSGIKYLKCGVEESPHYIEAVKRVRRRIKDTAFSDVLLTAVSASLNDFIVKYNKKVPDRLSAQVPVLPEARGLTKFVPVKHNVKKYVCENQFSLAMLLVPTRVESEKNIASEAILDRLEIVKRESKIFRTSIDFAINYFILNNFVGLLPLKILRPLSIALHCTFMISILPAPPACSVLGGYHVQDAIFWTPNRGPIGLGFSILSYDDRFQIGLIADKAIIPDENDVQEIIDGIYKYLDVLNLESDFSRV